MSYHQRVKEFKKIAAAMIEDTEVACERHPEAPAPAPTEWTDCPEAVAAWEAEQEAQQGEPYHRELHDAAYLIEKYSN